MSEELIQKNLVEAPEKMGDWNFYNIGATTLKALKGAKIIPDRDYDEYETKKPDALIVKKPLLRLIHCRWLKKFGRIYGPYLVLRRRIAYTLSLKSLSSNISATLGCSKVCTRFMTF